MGNKLGPSQEITLRTLSSSELKRLSVSTKTVPVPIVNLDVHQMVNQGLRVLTVLGNEHTGTQKSLITILYIVRTTCIKKWSEPKSSMG